MTQPGGRIELDNAAAPGASAGINFRKQVSEGLRIELGIGVDEEEPIASSGGGPSVSSPGDLIERFENDASPFVLRNLRGCIGGVVVGDDDLGLKASANILGA